METYLYRLCFDAPVHFGTTGIGLEDTREHLSSDSLTSALINALSVLGKAEEAVRSLSEKDVPGFVLSSLFPFGPWENGKQTAYALPRPLIRPRVTDENILRDQGKELGRIKYLGPEDFFSWIGDDPLDSKTVDAVVRRSRGLAKPWDQEKGQGWWATELRPRVALDRRGQASAIWRCETLRFHRHAGLYGLIRVREDWKQDLTAGFHLLGDLGLGGERTYGMGTFRFSGFEPLDEVWPDIPCQGTSRFVLLSNYFPAEDEKASIRENFEAWAFAENRGHVVSGRQAMTLKRKRIRMIAQGSVAKKTVRGKLADVTPDHAAAGGLRHPVYRSGLAFLMPRGGAE